ncbi:hypothetical protein UA45_18625 [Morganella morganii]|uniref:Uncharacterized protein n=1 Tax=Morganella morganii TaxID=582 RepID=A0A0D8L3F1_MORMO|nr:hypothetical protein UA45_18625 [Morganella morganii]
MNPVSRETEGNTLLSEVNTDILVVAAGKISSNLTWLNSINSGAIAPCRADVVWSDGPLSSP